MTNTPEWMTLKWEGKKPIFPPRGSFKAKLMLLAATPSSDDIKSRVLLSGEVGEELREAIDAAGIKPEDVYYTSVVKECVFSSKPSKALINKYSVQLKEEIAMVQPKLIMPLGAEAYKWLIQANKKLTGYLGEIITCDYGTILPNYSPGLIIGSDPTVRPVFKQNFTRARKYIYDELKEDTFLYRVITDVEQAKQVINKYIAEEDFYVGYDCEWRPGKWLNDETLYTIQFSCEEGIAIVLDLFHDGRTEDKALLETMKPLLEHPKVKRLGWNIRADDKRLMYRGFKLDEETLGFDGMKAMGFLDSRLNKGLEVGIENFSNLKHYYVNFHQILEKNKIKPAQLVDARTICSKEFFEYCAGDAIAHRRVCLEMMKRMEKLTPAIRNYYYQVYLPLSAYFADLEMTGIPVDVELMDSLAKMYSDKYAELANKLKDLISNYGFGPTAYKNAFDQYVASGMTEAAAAKAVNKAGIYEEFNPDSYRHKKILLFDRMQLTPAYYKKPKKQNPVPRASWLKMRESTQNLYTPSTNNKSLSSIRFSLMEMLAKNFDDKITKEKFVIIDCLLSMSRVGVFANKFFNKQGTVFADETLNIADEEEEATAEGDDDEDEIDGGSPLKSSYYAALCSDNRIHADFYECLANFRSSSRPNVQNPASKVLSHIPSIFVPGYNAMSKDEKKLATDKIPRNFRHILYAGPNKDWYWVEVDVAGADLMIAAYLSKDKDYISDMLRGNFHLHKAREYFRDEKITKDDYSKYVSAKAITFRVAYTAELEVAALPIQAEIYAESGIWIPEDTLTYALQTWYRYKDYMQFRTNCINEVKAYQRVTNMRGMPYLFERSTKPGILAGWYNESLAYPIASELALFLWDVSVSIKRQCKADGVWMKQCFPVNSVHDASYWVIHKDLLKDNYFPNLCHQYFCKKCKIVTGDNLGMEMVVGDRWKAKDVVFHGETTWDTNKKEWVLHSS